MRTNDNARTGDAPFGDDTKRRLYRLLRFFIFIVVAAYLGVIFAGALSITSMVTEPLKHEICCFDIPHQDVYFQTADGLTLYGWYVPPKNGAVIILLHAYYRTRRQVRPVAQMLVNHGYGVLLYDQRASGLSEGEVRSLGWLDIPDVSRAVSWVQKQPGVEKNRIGVYGCSMGGAIGLAGAAQDSTVAAVVADAPSPLTFDEAQPPFDGPYWFVNFPISGMYYALVSLRAKILPSIPTHQAAQMIAPRPLLLISTGQPGEAERVDGFYAAAGQPKRRWHIPEASHCGGPSTRPGEYEQELAEFFDGALLTK